MLRERIQSDSLSEFMRFLANLDCSQTERLPALTDLSQQLGISVSTLREQMEVARALGLVEVRPRTGIRRLPYTFSPAIRRSLAYAMAIDEQTFLEYGDFRNHIESAYWYQAVGLLTSDDQAELRGLVASAKEKLSRHPVQIPHHEHRELHLLIYRRLNNPFVTGALEAYWETYEAAGLNVYTDFNYLQRVWQYHEKMVEAICAGDYAGGFQALAEHKDMLQQRSQPAPRHNFE